MTTPVHCNTVACPSPPDMKQPLVELFAEMFPAYERGSDEIKSVIRSMVAICNDPNATDEERRDALDVLVEAIFGDPCDPGVDLENIAEFEGEDAVAIEAAMDEEEAVFAKTLRRLMKERRVTQKQLAAQIGVGQPAVSMMLSRRCRPQKATVKKIAVALGVEPKEIWPNF